VGWESEGAAVDLGHLHMHPVEIQPVPDPTHDTSGDVSTFPFHWRNGIALSSKKQPWGPSGVVTHALPVPSGGCIGGIPTAAPAVSQSSCGTSSQLWERQPESVLFISYVQEVGALVFGDSDGEPLGALVLGDSDAWERVSLSCHAWERVSLPCPVIHAWERVPLS